MRVDRRAGFFGEGGRRAFVAGIAVVIALWLLLG
jgi:hypothetical protein